MWPHLDEMTTKGGAPTWLLYNTTPIVRIHEILRLETPPLGVGRKGGPPKAGAHVRCLR